MGHTRPFTISTTTSYQNMATLVAAISGATDKRRFENGYFRVASAASNSVRISIGRENASTGSDSLSNLFAPGEYCPFDFVDLNQVWVKSLVGASTLEFLGSEVD